MHCQHKQKILTARQKGLRAASKKKPNPLMGELRNKKTNCPSTLILKLEEPTRGLGAVLLQQHDQDWKPVAYASRFLLDAEKRYAQIENEAVAVTWACEKFSTYVLGRYFQVETDHKPLVPLLNTKHLDNLPPRFLRFRLRLAKYNYTAYHTPVKLLYAADALSRAPLSERGEEELQEEVEAYISHVTMSSIPASPQKLEQIRKAQIEDVECSQAREFCRTEWPIRDTESMWGLSY